MGPHRLSKIQAIFTMNGFKNHAGLSLTMMCGLASAQNISDGCGASHKKEQETIILKKREKSIPLLTC